MSYMTFWYESYAEWLYGDIKSRTYIISIFSGLPLFLFLNYKFYVYPINMLFYGLIMIRFIIPIFDELKLNKYNNKIHLTLGLITLIGAILITMYSFYIYFIA